MSNKNETSVRVIENASLDDVRPGDYLIWGHARQVDGVTIRHLREGVAACRYGNADWYTKDGQWITDVNFPGTLTIRRPITKEG